MNLTPEQVQQVAHLARLQVSPQQVGHYATQLSSILKMVGQLSDASTDGVSPMAHPLDMVQRLRADQVSEPDRRETFQAIAPAVEAGVYLVPKVIE